MEFSHLQREYPLGLVDIWANQSYIHMLRHEASSARNCIMQMLAVEVEGLPTHLAKEYLGSLIMAQVFYLNRHEDEHISNMLQNEREVYERERWEYPSEFRAALDYSLGVYFHAIADRTQALKCLNRVLNDGDIKRDEDVYHRTLVLVTVLHIESRDKEWMAHGARALKRYLKPRDLLNGVEQILLEYIADLRRARTEEGEDKALNQFIHKLRQIRREPKERIAFEHFDFLAWAESQAGEEATGLVA